MQKIRNQSEYAPSILQPFYPRALTDKAFNLAGNRSINQISIPARQRISINIFSAIHSFTLHQHAREFLITLKLTSVLDISLVCSPMPQDSKQDIRDLIIKELLFPLAPFLSLPVPKNKPIPTSQPRYNHLTSPPP